MSPTRHATAPPFLRDYALDPYCQLVGNISLTREVFRRPREDPHAPPVILIHEIPTINQTTVNLGNLIHRRGFTVVLPSLIGTPVERNPRAQARRDFASMCMSAMFGALAYNRTAPIVDWLRGLARRESALAGGRSVAVIGMCFSGGFALATILEDRVAAAVMSQPALPFIVGSDLGLSPADLATVKDKVGRGSCVRILRYSRDWKSPRSRFDRVECEFPDSERVEIQTENRADHSVLRDGIGLPRGTDLGDALQGTLDFLDDHLKSPAERAGRQGG